MLKDQSFSGGSEGSQRETVRAVKAKREAAGGHI